jgi:hypothetical protein
LDSRPNVNTNEGRDAARAPQSKPFRHGGKDRRQLRWDGAETVKSVRRTQPGKQLRSRVSTDDGSAKLVSCLQSPKAVDSIRFRFDGDSNVTLAIDSQQRKQAKAITSTEEGMMIERND